MEKYIVHWIVTSLLYTYSPSQPDEFGFKNTVIRCYNKTDTLQKTFIEFEKMVEFYTSLKLKQKESNQYYIQLGNNKSKSNSIDSIWVKTLKQ